MPRMVWHGGGDRRAAATQGGHTCQISGNPKRFRWFGSLFLNWRLRRISITVSASAKSSSDCGVCSGTSQRVALPSDTLFRLWEGVCRLPVCEPNNACFRTKFGSGVATTSITHVSVSCDHHICLRTCTRSHALRNHARDETVHW